MILLRFKAALNLKSHAPSPIVARCPRIVLHHTHVQRYVYSQGNTVQLMLDMEPHWHYTTYVRESQHFREK